MSAQRILTQHILTELARVKAIFQQRALVAAMGITPNPRPPRCAACGATLCDHPDPVYAGVVPDPARGASDSAGVGIPLSACPGAFPDSIHNGPNSHDTSQHLV